MTDHFKRTTCRLCDHNRLELVVPITATPVADAYVSKDKLDVPQACYPLDLYQCLDCGHVQILDVVDARIIFNSEYSYRTGRTPALLKHFEEYAKGVIALTNLAEGSLVLEVGSNDGTFLRFFQERGMKVLGIDPATNIVRAANEAGIETISDYFNLDAARRIRAERGPVRVIAANNVFAHNDDMAGMAEGVRMLLADDGVFVFEVSYLLDVIDHMLLGTIFHEHVCYHSVQPLDAFLKLHGMELIDVRRVGIQGGSIICSAQKTGGPHGLQNSVAELKALEDARDLRNPATLRAFSSRLESIRKETSELVARLHREGKSVAGFGAARGGTLLIYHFNLGGILEFIVDDSPDKQNLFSPGFHIPILPTAALYERKPDCVFILAWVHSKAIIKNHQRYIDEGGIFITCFPEMQIVGGSAAVA